MWGPQSPPRQPRRHLLAHERPGSIEAHHFGDAVCAVRQHPFDAVGVVEHHGVHGLPFVHNRRRPPRAPLPAVQFGHSGETQQPLRFDVVAGEQTFRQLIGQMRRIVDVHASPSPGMSSHAGPPGDLPSGASIDWPVRFTVTRLHGAAACDTAPVPESSMRKKFPKFSWQLMTGRRIAHDNGRCHQCPRINARLKRKSRP